jgi:hypothetical protein
MADTWHRPTGMEELDISRKRAQASQGNRSVGEGAAGIDHPQLSIPGTAELVGGDADDHSLLGEGAGGASCGAEVGVARKDELANSPKNSEKTINSDLCGC